MKSLSDLKRALIVGAKVKRLFGRHNIGEVVEVTRTQSNGVYLNKSYLDFPPASLLDYDGKIVTIYAEGKRPLTPEEQAILDGRPRDPEQEHIDAMTDGSMCYWRDKRYFKEQDAEWYWGWSKGKRYSHNNVGFMYDKKVKGEKILQYEIL